ncbi:MAG: sugar kinase [Chloroflexi bacterium]|nr:sugar kinase [Chloroflexota bacterium]MCC6891749.1 sugar kinase [Anaerolineae bacterium]
MYDLISLGEVMLRLAPPKFERLRRTRSLDVEVAGAQLNIAANIARLGKKSAFISKLPDNELGVLAYDSCAAYGVDMSHVKRVPNTRMGMNFLEFTATPRVGVTIFDRRGSAASTITVDDFDWSALAAQTRIAHTDGIVPGLSTGCREATTAYLQAARDAGCVTSFDVNYREHLWTEATALECWKTLLPLVDIVVTSRSVSEAVFGFTGSDADIMQAYHDSFGHKLICLTHREIMGVLQGAWSSKALYDGQVLTGRRYEFDVVDRFGTGDAFFAGLLYGYLDDTPQFALDFGNAACALAHTIEGDVAQFTAAEVLLLLKENIDLRVKR